MSCTHELGLNLNPSHLDLPSGYSCSLNWNHHFQIGRYSKIVPLGISFIEPVNIQLKKYQITEILHAVII